MKYSENLHLALPEGGDPLEVSKLSENFVVLDRAIKDQPKVGVYHVGDIIYSSRNLEEETDGVWIACDQREVFVSDYPELCSLSFIKNRLALFQKLHPNSEGVTSFEIGTPKFNARVGDRYVFTKSVKNANWNTYAGLYDLSTGQTASFENVGVYIDDNILIASIESGTASLYLYVITDGTLGPKRAVGPLQYSQCYGIFAFKDKYVFLRSTSVANTNSPMYETAWEFVDTVLNGSTSVTLKTNTYGLKPGFELYKRANVAYMADNPTCFDVPFRAPVCMWQDKLWTLNCIRPVADTTKTYLALMQSDDAITWTQTDIMYELPKTFSGTYYITLGIVDGQLYIVLSWYLQDNGYDRYTYVYVYNTDLDLVNSYTIEGFNITSIETSISIRDGYMYAYGTYQYKDAVTPGQVMPLIFNLETGEVSYFNLPPYAFNRSSQTYQNTFKHTHGTLFGPEVYTDVTPSYNTGTYGDCTGSRAITEYDFELGRLINTTGTTPRAVSSLILDNPKLQYVQYCTLPYNSDYIFFTGSNSGLFVADRKLRTRVLPYIKNGYIKALNEGGIE